MTTNLPARVYPPGAVEFYSNYGYALAGALIEDATGGRYEDYVTQNVLLPIGMRHSSLTQPLPAPLDSLLAPGSSWYQRAAAAGALSATAADLSRLLIATLHQDSGVVTPASFAAMTTPNSAPSGLVHRLGYWTGRDHGQAMVGGSGDAGSYHTVMVAFPNSRLGLLVTVSGGGNVATGFYHRFLDAVFGTTSAPPTPPVPAPVPLGAPRLDDFAGYYRTVRYPHSEIAKTFVLLDLTSVSVREGVLQMDGVRWVRTGALEFTSGDGAEVRTFGLDARSRVAYLDGNERIAWYQTGYANIAFYFLFLVCFAVAWRRSRGQWRWVPALPLVHGVGWLVVVLVTGPANLIFGIPLGLRAVLWLGTAIPLLAFAAIYRAVRERTALSLVTAAALVAYVPFVWYWNLYSTK